MREILFRGKPTERFKDFLLIRKEYDKEGFVHGSLIIDGYDRTYICFGGMCSINSIINNGITTMVEVVPETVGQFTGLVDIYGKKIFEGDIHGMPGWVVTYCADVNNSLGMNAGWYIQRNNWESWIELENHTEHHIIGNIHDNPELLRFNE